MLKRWIFIVPLFLFFACENNSSSQIISEELYEKLFIELAVINQLDEKILVEITREELEQQIYDHYGVTKEQFRVSHTYYENQLEKQMERTQRLSQKLRNERELIQRAEQQYKEENRVNIDSLRQVIFNR